LIQAGQLRPELNPASMNLLGYGLIPLNVRLPEILEYELRDYDGLATSDNIARLDAVSHGDSSL